MLRATQNKKYKLCERVQKKVGTTLLFDSWLSWQAICGVTRRIVSGRVESAPRVPSCVIHLISGHLYSVCGSRVVSCAGVIVRAPLSSCALVLYFRRDICLICRWKSTLLYVYTSGTTGLPKASKISHLRFFSAAALFSTTARLRPEDR